MKKLLFSLLMPFITSLCFGQLLTEGFDDITTLEGNGWIMTNQSNPIGTSNWFQGNSGTFPGHQGGATSYIGANFNNTAGAGTISNWLIFPTLSLKDGDQLKFWTRVPTGGNIFPDRLEVRASTGTMTLPSGATSVGSFTNLLLSINESLGNSYPETWTEYTVTLSGIGNTPVNVNLAFRYYVTNGGPSGSYSNYIGIDTVSVIEAGDGSTDYCGPIEFDFSIEPITNVVVAGIANATDPTINGSPAHEFFLDIVGNMEPGESYPIALEGNTAGGFTNRFAVFIDWNQNGILNDPGEVYEMDNTIFNSTGTDGQQALGTITVPADALPGATRMRVKKIFGVSNFLDPCAGAGYGQVEDYTIQVGGDEGGGDECAAVNPPYFQNFETASVPNMPECTTVENAGTGNNWQTYTGTNGSFTGTYLRYAWNTTNPANTWFYTQALNLTAGVTYKVKYDYGSASSSAYPESLRVAYGTNNTHTAMTTILADHPTILTGSEKLTNEVEFTPETSGVYYIGFQAYSAADMFYLFLDDISVELVDGGGDEGCLDAPNGQYPSNIYTPSCVGVPEEITPLAWTGEYSLVNVTAGTEYVFSSSVPTDFVTISDENGTTVYAAGTTPVTWTATADETIRFYLHFDSDCNWADSGLRSRIVQCGEVPPPPSACEDFEVLSNNLENGLFFGGSTNQRMAVDVPVAENGFTVYGMEPTVIGEATSFTFTFYQDNGGVPGTQFATRTGTIMGEEITGNNFGYDFIKYTVEFDQPIDFEANTTYWIEVQSDAVAWEVTSNPFSILGNDDVFWNTNVSGWTPTDGDQYVFNLVCQELGVTDLTSFDFAYYPNPVKDVLNINAKKAVKTVEAFNLAGQKVMNDAQVSNGQINVSTLTPGTYVFRVVLQGGQVETFKIIKK